MTLHPTRTERSLVLVPYKRVIAFFVLFTAVTWYRKQVLVPATRKRGLRTRERSRTGLRRSDSATARSIVRWRARTIVQRHCARRASRPQRKREPLGGVQRPCIFQTWSRGLFRA